MKAGRELDVLVAEKIFGLDPKWLGQPASFVEIMSDGHRLKNYSTNIEDAWKVVKRIAEDGAGDHLVINIRLQETHCTTGWRCWLEIGDIVHEAIGTSAPYVICLVALRAKGIFTDGRS